VSPAGVYAGRLGVVVLLVDGVEEVEELFVPLAAGALLVVPELLEPMELPSAMP